MDLFILFHSSWVTKHLLDLHDAATPPPKKNTQNFMTGLAPLYHLVQSFQFSY